MWDDKHCGRPLDVNKTVTAIEINSSIGKDTEKNREKGQDFPADEVSSEESFDRRVDTQPKKKKSGHSPGLNQRGRPARLRTQNRMIFCDNVVTDKKAIKQLTPKKGAPNTQAIVSNEKIDKTNSDWGGRSQNSTEAQEN